MDVLLGMIALFGFGFAPRGWATCSGQVLSIAQNTALFSLLGTTYGGNGQTTFALPDLRGRLAVGQGQGPGLSNYAMGQSGGVEGAPLTLGELPQHDHVLTVTGELYGETAIADKKNPQGNMLATPTAADIYAASNPSANKLMAADAVKVTGTVGTTGGSQSVSTLQPFVTLNYCIALEGIFPSRN